MLNTTFVLESSDYWNSLDEPSNLPIVARDGTIRRYTGSLSDITLNKVFPTVDPWQNHYRNVLTELVDSGIRQFDFDGVPWQWVPNCWNDNHDHPKGRGGNWHTQRFRKLLQDLHMTSSIDEDLVLGGEGIADFYLPFMNLHVIRDGYAEVDDPTVRNGNAEVVPMFPYTYGDYAATRSLKGHIGVQSGERNPQRLIAGRAIEWGAIPLFMGVYEYIYDKEIVEYYSKIGKARNGYANRFLGHGEMLSPPDIERQMVSISQNEHSIETPEIRGNAWRSPKGDLGIVLTNVSNRDESRTISIDFKSQSFELPTTPLVYIVRNGQYRAVSNTRVTVKLEPSDIALIAAIPDSSAARDSLAMISQAQSVLKNGNDKLEDAKRAFDAHEFERAKEISAEAKKSETSKEADTEVSTKSETNKGSTTGEQTDSGPKESPNNEPTAVDSPGFSIMSSLGAVLGYSLSVKLLKRLFIDDDNQDGKLEPNLTQDNKSGKNK